MSWCAVVNCHNDSKRNHDKSYFQLPKDEHLKKTWVRLINRTELPKRVYVCSDHFQESCFDQVGRYKTDYSIVNVLSRESFFPVLYPLYFPIMNRLKKDTHRKRYRNNGGRQEK